MDVLVKRRRIFLTTRYWTPATYSTFRMVLCTIRMNGRPHGGSITAGAITATGEAYASPISDSAVHISWKPVGYTNTNSYRR